MSSMVLTMTLAVVLGQAPYGGTYGGSYSPQPAGAFYSSGQGPVGFAGGWAGMTGGGASSQGAEQLYIFDAYEPWVHGYWQEIPHYGGNHYYRPYNYKHLLSQSQVAGGWGMSPTMPYSHEYFRRGRERGGYDRQQRIPAMEGAPLSGYSPFRSQHLSQAVPAWQAPRASQSEGPLLIEPTSRQPIGQTGYIPSRQ